MTGSSQTPAGRAVIYIPHRREQDRWERVCVLQIADAGDRLVAVVGPDGRGWADAQAMIDNDEADVIVVGRWDHVPCAALPHVRVVAEHPDVGQRRRPRVIDP